MLLKGEKVRQGAKTDLEHTHLFTAAQTADPARVGWRTVEAAASRSLRAAKKMGYDSGGGTTRGVVAKTAM